MENLCRINPFPNLLLITNLNLLDIAVSRSIEINGGRVFDISEGTDYTEDEKLFLKSFTNLGLRKGSVIRIFNNLLLDTLINSAIDLARAYLTYANLRLTSGRMTSPAIEVLSTVNGNTYDTIFSDMDSEVARIFLDSKGIDIIRLTQFKLDIMGKVLYSQGSTGSQYYFIKSENDLNRAFAEFKELLFKNIVQFLEGKTNPLTGEIITFPKNSNGKVDISLYDKNTGMFNKEMYFKVINIAQKYIESLDNRVNTLYFRALESISEKIDLSNPLFLVNNYLNLKYFNENLNKAAKGAININRLYRKSFPNLYVDKANRKYSPVYTFSKGNENSVKDWTTLYRDAVSEASPLAKMVVNSILLVDTNGTILNRTLEMVDVMNAWTSLKSLILSNYSKFNHNIDAESLAYRMSNLNNHPYELIDAILRSIFFTRNGENSILDTLFLLGYNKDYLNYLYSVYIKGLQTNTRSRLDGSYHLDTNLSNSSLAKKETVNLIRLDIPVTKLSYRDILLGIIQKTAPASYLSTVTSSDGAYETKVISTYESVNSRAFDYRGSMNIQYILNGIDHLRRVDLLQKYIKDYPDLKIQSSIIIKLGNRNLNLGLFNITRDETGRTLLSLFETGRASLKEVSVTGNESMLDRILEIVKSLTASLIDSIYNRMIGKSQELTEDLEMVANLFSLIEDTLHLGLRTKPKLHLLTDYYILDISNFQNDIIDMLKSSIRILAINDLYVRYEDFLVNNEDISLQKWIEEAKIPGMAKSYQRTLGGTDLRALLNEPWIDSWFKYESLSSGEASRAALKNASNNTIAKNRPYSIAAEYQEKITEALKTEGTADRLLLIVDSNNRGVLRGMHYALDFESTTNITKEATELNILELLYSNIVFNFFNSWLNNNTINILPTTPSDKTTLPMYEWSMNHKLQRGDILGKGTSLANMTSQLCIDIYKDTIGRFYLTIYEDTIDRYTRLLNDEIPDLQTLDIREKEYSINNWLKTHTYSQLRDIQIRYNQTHNDKIDLTSELHYTKKGKNLLLNPLLRSYAYVFLLSGLTETLIEEARRQFTLDLLEYNVNFYTYFLSDSNILDSSHPLNLFINSKKYFLNDEDRKAYSNKWIKNGLLIIAMQEDKILYSGDTIDKSKQFELNPLLEKYFYTDLVTSSLMKYLLVGSELIHKDTSSLNDLSANSDEKLYLAGKDLGDLLDSIDNPMSARYFMLAFYNSIGGREGSQYKRNALLVSTGDSPINDSLIGPVRKFQVACIEQKRAKVHNINGESKNDLEARDGSSWLCPLTSIELNGGLEAKSMGVDTAKTIIVHKDSKTGSLFIAKHNSFVPTTETMIFNQDSVESDLALFKRMTNIPFASDINLVYGISLHLLSRNGIQESKDLNFGYQILSNLDVGNLLLYKADNGQVREITDFDLIDGIYITEESTVHNDTIYVAHLYDLYSNHYTIESNLGEDTESFITRVKETISGNYHTINSLYELYMAFGGIYSVQLNEEGLYEPSNNSLYAVSNLMNSYTRLKPEKLELVQKALREGTTVPVFDPNLANFEQPLKEYKIDLIGDPSSFKSFTTNINPVSSWTDSNPLLTITIDSSCVRYQLDPDHEVEEAEISEFTLVIASLDAGGNMHWLAREAFADLAKITLNKLKVNKEALEKFIEELGEEAASELYDKVVRTFLKHYNADRVSSDIAKEFMVDLELIFNISNKHGAEEIKLPLSDPNFFRSVINVFMNTVNESVKRKYSGLGCLLVPGYDRFLLHTIQGNTYTYNDILNNIILELSLEYLKLKLYDIGTFSLYKEWKAWGEEHPFNTYISLLHSRESTNNRLVSNYLKVLQANQEFISLDSIQPTDVIRMYSTQLIDGQNANNEYVFDLDGRDEYYHFKNQHWLFFSRNRDEILNRIKQNPTFNALTEWQLYNYISENYATNEQIKLILSEYSSDEMIALYTSAKSYKLDIINPRNLAPGKARWQYKDELGNIRYCNIYDIDETFNAYIGLRNLLAIDKALIDIEQRGTFKLKGRTYEVIKGSLEVSEAELIMSNIYENNFDTRGKSLVQALDSIKTVTVTKEDTVANSQLVLSHLNGDNVYINFKSAFDTDNLTDKEDINLVEFDDIITEYSRTYSNLNFFITLKNGKKIQIGGGVYLADIAFNNGVFTNLTTGKVLTDDETKNLRYDSTSNRVYEYNLFIKKYELSKLVNKVARTFTLYEFDEEAFRRVMDARTLDNGGYNYKGYVAYCARTLKDLFNSDIYKTLLLSGKIVDSKLLNNIFKYMEDTTTDDILQDCVKVNRKYLQSNPKVSTIDKLYFDELKDTILNKVNKYKKSSLELSRYFISARIPALTLLSYMNMKLVAYYPTRVNRAVVSHWQTWLQGSDYDVDKSYIMGFSFSNFGKFIDWSPLFNYDTVQTLRASLTLPMPSDIKVSAVEGQSELDINEEFDSLQNYLNYLENPTQNILNNGEKEASVRILAKLISKIDKFAKDNKITLVKLNVSNYKDPSTLILLINNHESYIIPEEEYEQAVKNAVAGRIQAISSAISNFSLATSPITMENLRDSSKISPKGKSLIGKIALSPSTKFNMIEINMVGKKVIGITAVGEKVFMGLSYYFNEGITREDWYPYMRFSLTYNRILGRASGEPVSIERRDIANTNYYTMFGLDSETIRDRFLLVNLLREMVRAENLNKPDEEVEKIIEERIKSLKSTTEHVDLMISLLLSAATDNAKELILGSINCNSETARMYLHLLILGFNIEDIVAFMTSRAAESVIKFNKVNMFNEFNNSSKLKYAILRAQGIIHSSSYFKFNSTAETNEFTMAIYSLKELIAQDEDLLQSCILYLNLLLPEDKLLESTKESFMNSRGIKLLMLSNFITVSAITDHNNYNKIINYLNNWDNERLSKQPNNMFNAHMHAFIQEMLYVIKTIGITDNDYLLDIKEYLTIYELSDETSLLGTTWFGLNRGIPNTPEDILIKVANMERLVYDRELKYGLTKKADLDDALISLIKQSKPYLEETFIKDTLENSKDIIGQFDMEKYLFDDDYKNRVIDYYNLLKDQYNVFHIMENSSQYLAALEAFKTGFGALIYSSRKGMVLNKIRKKLKEEGLFVDEKVVRKLNSYSEELLLKKFIDSDLSFTFTIPENNYYYDANMSKTKLVGKDITLDLKSLSGRASFKYYIELIVYPRLLAEYKDNIFVLNLIYGKDGDKRILKLNIRMKEVNNSSTNISNYLAILRDLSLLKNVQIDGNNLIDMLVLYNLLTLLNHSGNDRLTEIFKDFVSKESGSRLYQYLLSVGNYDYPVSITAGDNLLEELGFSVDDALFKIAPIYNEHKKDFAKEAIIIVSDSEGLHYERKIAGSYTKYNPFSRFSGNEKRILLNIAYDGTLVFPERDSDARYSNLLDEFSSNLQENVYTVLKELILNRYFGMLYNC